MSSLGVLRLLQQSTGRVLISPGTTKLLRELAIDPQMGWEAARGVGLQCGRSVVWRDGLAQRQSRAKRPRGRVAMGAALNPYPNPYPILPIFTPSPWPSSSLLWSLETPAVPMQLLAPC